MRREGGGEGGDKVLEMKGRGEGEREEVLISVCLFVAAGGCLCG